MNFETEVKDNIATIRYFKKDNSISLSFSLDSMRTMRFFESTVKAEKASGERRKGMAYIDIMSKAIRMVGEDAFESLEDFYEEEGVVLTVEDFIGSIMGVFVDSEELPKD